MAGKIQTAAKELQAMPQQKSMKDLVRSAESAIRMALPSVLTPERFSRIMLSAISTNPALSKCTQKSFLGSMMNAAQLGLEPNTPTGQAYLIPYKNKREGTIECQFQIGYRGWIQLAYRSNMLQSLVAEAVHEQDDFELEYGSEGHLRHRPALKDRGDVIGYYAMFKTTGGGESYCWMSKEDVEKHAAQYSESYYSEYSPWRTNFDAMAKKTCIKQLLKYAPISADLIRATSVDETTQTDLNEFEGLPDDILLGEIVAEQEDTIAKQEESDHE